MHGFYYYQLQHFFSFFRKQTIKFCLEFKFSFLLFIFLQLISCRRLHEEYHFSITIAQAIIAFFVISNLFATTFVDPGIIKRGETNDKIFFYILTILLA